jgi:polyhydroxyalkanoate synthesis regulator phasin
MSAPCRTLEHLAWLATVERDAARWPGLCWNHVAREIDRESDQRRRVYPDLVARGQMTQAEADYQIAIFDALKQDVARIMANRCDEAPAHSFTRGERIAAILRERDYRKRLFPKWVSTGQITQEQAKLRQHGLDCLLECFDQGLDFDPEKEDLEALKTTYAARWCRAEQQKELAL